MDLIKQAIFHAQLIGRISAQYDIPLAEIKELEKRLKRSEKIKAMKEAEEQKAAREKFNKTMPVLSVVRGGLEPE